MKKIYSAILLICALPSVINSALAQSENSGTVTNDGGIIDNYPVWLNTEDGKYIGSNNGIFNHFGPASKTFTNNGIYQAGTGHKDIFKGPDPENGIQEIGGLKRPDFFNVDFVNGSSSAVNITNAEGISVAGTLNFQNGITTTLRNIHQAGAIQFEPGALFTNANTDNQHVNGYVSKIGNTAFVFPVGSGTDLRELEISAPANATTHVSVAWIAGDPGSMIDPSDASPNHSITSVKGAIKSVSNLGQWDWIPVVASGNQLTVKVSIPDVSGFSTAGDLRLVGWSVDSWIDLSGAANASGNTENSILTGNIHVGTTITALGIGSVKVPLPVRLISFEAGIFEKTSTQLFWTTASEQNNDYFQIEHSTDARNFEPVGRVKGKGTTSQKSDYSYLHTLSLPSGIHYYRLKQVDYDGSFAYSSIRSVDFGELVTSIYPNPASDKINVELAGWNNLKSIELFDESGRSVYQSEEKKPLLKIDTRYLTMGIYLIKIQYTDGSFISTKVLVTK